MRRALHLIVALLLSGCTPITWTQVTLNQPLRAQDIRFIDPGRTQWTEVVRRLGAPGELQPTPSGFVATYFYLDTADFDVDLGWPLGFIGPVSRAPHRLELGDTGIGVEELEVAVGTDLRVQYAVFADSNDAARFKPVPVGD